jgi:hypothetical protein
MTYRSVAPGGEHELFGFDATAMRLPEVLGGALAVPLLYDLLRRLFSRGAGLGAGAASRTSGRASPLIAAASSPSAACPRPTAATARGRTSRGVAQECARRPTTTGTQRGTMRWRRCLLLPPGAPHPTADTSGSAKAPGSLPPPGAFRAALAGAEHTLEPDARQVLLGDEGQRAAADRAQLVRLAYETGPVVWTVVGLVLTPIGAGLATQTRLR